MINLTDKDINRFWSKVDKSGDCWIWTAGVSEKSRSLKLKFRHIRAEGYGSFSVKHKTFRAPRIAWYIIKGYINDDMVLDHVKGKCTTTLCVNPEHLELVTNEENLKRAKKTVCNQGHLQIPENRRSYKSKNNGIQYRCKLCKW